MEEKYEDLKKRIDHLQYDEIKPLKEDLTDMKITLSNNDLLTKQAIESNQKLSDSLEVLKSTMVEVAQSVKDSNRINGEITKTIEELNKKITSVETNTKNSIDDFSAKLDRMDEKAKIDILEWLKSKWFEVILTLGALAYVISQTINK